jgi:hypothetical protein
MSGAEIAEYLEGFSYRLGEREREAMRVFESLVEGIQELVTEKE